MELSPLLIMNAAFQGEIFKQNHKVAQFNLTIKQLYTLETGGIVEEGENLIVGMTVIFIVASLV